MNAKSLTFDADGRLFRLLSEAWRIRWAHLFDRFLAVDTSLVEPLPHQVTAVYEVMLRRQPLRFLLADDPGAGKTIMTGLLVKELWLRGALRRCLIVAPGNLVAQWQEELARRFALSFELLSKQMIDAAGVEKVFERHPLLIARLDKLARDKRVQAKLANSAWDLIVCDEAHKMSATFFGGKVKLTKRYRLGSLLSKVTRHFLLLTATPHNGKEADFQLFLALLDQDRFAGRFRDGVHQVEASDLMRRMVKEKLVRFDGTPLFPERRAYTVPYRLSPLENKLYEGVTEYVRQEFNRADALSHKGRRGTVGFALMVLQRRLASSPEAIYQSLKRRRCRLEGRLTREQAQRHHSRLLGEQELILSAQDIDALEDAPAAEVEQVEQEMIDLATAADTVAELRLEIATLHKLEQEALIVRNSGQDRKWAELSRLLQDEREMFDAQGKRRKLLIFTEHRDTLTYLVERIRVLLGRADAVVMIYGGMSRTARRKAEATFKQDGQAYVLLATDAAGEGINLQVAHLMINYDLPWNPNRLEQRFGRIHRIGQQEVCHLWNVVAQQTREGDVYLTLLRKLERARAALGGAVFDVLGQALEGVALRKLMMEAIRYGEQAEVRARLTQVVEGALDEQRLHKLLHEEALAPEMLNRQHVRQVRQQMARMQTQRFQPYYVTAFFQEAFKHLGGRLRQRETGRYEITRVPTAIRKEMTSNRALKARYKRICFDKSLVSQPNKPDAELICPGHPLLDATVAQIIAPYGDLLAQGTTLIDENDPTESCRLLFYVQYALQDARRKPDGTHDIFSQRVHFIELWPDDDNRPPQEAGLAPYLDYRPLREPEWPLIWPLLAQLPASEHISERVIRHVRETLLATHLHEVQQERLPLIRKTQAAVKERLTKEIYYWDNQARQLQEKEAAQKTNQQTNQNTNQNTNHKTNAHKSAKMNASNASQRADALHERLQTRLKELEEEAAALQAVFWGRYHITRVYQ